MKKLMALAILSVISYTSFAIDHKPVGKRCQGAKPCKENQLRAKNCLCKCIKDYEMVNGECKKRLKIN
jgi:hypothetical protein